MVAFISFGLFDKKYFYIIGIILLTCPISIFINSYDKEYNHHFNCFFYSFLIFFGQFLCIIPTFIIKKSLNGNKTSNIKSEYQNAKIIEYIFNDPMNNNLGTSDIVKIFFISLLKLLYFALDIFFFIKILESKNDDDDESNEYEYIYESFYKLYSPISYCIFLLFSKYFLKREYYRHQYYSVFLLIIIGVTQIVVTFFIKENENFHFIYILYGFFGSLILVFINSIIKFYTQFLMKFKNFSIYKCCYIYGFFNLPIIIIIIVIVSFFPCSYPICVVYDNNNKEEEDRRKIY